jgi:hypothetical protein
MLAEKFERDCDRNYKQRAQETVAPVSLDFNHNVDVTHLLAKEATRLMTISPAQKARNSLSVGFHFIEVPPGTLRRKSLLKGSIGRTAGPVNSEVSHG